MMPNVVRGSNAAGLVYYLFGPGRANEHSDPHIIAAADVMAFMYGYVPGRRLIPEEARLAGADL
ncbi:MAG: hypothetical protein IKZ87_08495, partial [Actinomycetaceae bacterium]|nr:hypothetical protein [Actinomycetaceae bacterium]